MKTKIMVLVSIISAVFFVNSISYSQVIETVGAGVIDFLLTNPKTASQTNASEAAALSVIGNLLSISGQRKHEMNVAAAGRSEIVINTTNGSQATMYSDNQGNVYLLFNGTIYPLSSGIVNQARQVATEIEIKNSTLHSYNLATLKNEFKFEKKEYRLVYRRYYLKVFKETISEIALKHNVSRNDIYFQPYILMKGEVIYLSKKYSISDLLNTQGISKSAKKYILKIYNSLEKLVFNEYGSYIWTEGSIKYKFPGYEHKFKSPSGHAVFIRIHVPNKYVYEIVTSFTCNWSKDIDGQGLDFVDFHGIKRSFYEVEDILFVLGYTTELGGTWELEVYEALTGKTVYSKKGVLTKGAHVLTINKEGEKLPLGSYLYYFKLIAEGQKDISKSEKFEILRSE